MRLLTLALLVALPQQTPGPQPAWRRQVTLVSWSDAPVRAGLQVGVAMPLDKKAPKAWEVQIWHRGKQIPSWFQDDSSAWFKLQEDLPARGRDGNYEIRYGGGKALARGREVFAFFDEFEGKELDPARWEWDRGLSFAKDDRGLAITTLPGGRNEHAPLSLVPRLGSIPRGFVFEVHFSWKIAPGSAFTFAVKADVENKAAVTEEDRVRVAKLIRDLGADEIEVREQATKELVKLGAAALPQLMEAAKAQDPEVRVRTVAAVDAIYRDNPPPAIATGYSAPGAAERKLDLMMQVGKSRALLKAAAPPETRLQKVMLWRDEDGESSVGWDDRKPRLFPVPGQVTGLRIDFWAPQAGPIGEVRISRVILRRYVETMPSVEYGPHEAAR